MPDRSPRLLTLPQQSAQPGGRSAVVLRERPSSPPDSSSDRETGGERGGASQEDNPFAPPPEGTPDRPWQPRHPSGDDSRGSQGDGGGRSPWGRQWSDRQPGRSAGNFGERPGGSGPEGQGGGGPRWDPADPAQRRARYALLSGMWALFFALFTWPYVALLLGALGLYWGISALNAKVRAAGDPDTPAPPPEQTGRPQRTAAISGLVTSSLALVLVAASFGAQLVYRDYYTCENDALTNEAQQSCDRHLPEQLRDLLDTGD
ncbi:hypothetical protein [Streptomyces sp. AC627_RSS907]|uniref:hypothetical protein n=1 Tax=Streptomyces sp. AC627_RSS907 TaxID=2823684 RepID=UPI001C22A5D7|nr:hypothetical protein [Streptomyces sp. AC627_RSS907]